MIVLLQAADTEQHAFRATTSSFFAVCDIVAIPLIVISGAVTATGWWCALASLPAVVVGDAIGHRLAYRIDQEQFRRLVLVLLSLTAVVTLAVALV